ncbi:MAG: hypothetical protein ACM3SY_00340 [Candidatus Omnitrophota bacterium]
MKRFSYTWEGDIFLLHIQLTHGGEVERDVSVIREYTDGNIKNESVKVKEGVTSHRFMISRGHPKEKSFYLDYPEAFTLEAFKLDDRAYYPTESFFIG